MSETIKLMHSVILNQFKSQFCSLAPPPPEKRLRSFNISNERFFNDPDRYSRYNDYKYDNLSKCSCSPPYSAENAISARSDLNPANGSYPFSFLGHRNHGGTDCKVRSGLPLLRSSLGRKRKCYRCISLKKYNINFSLQSILII